MFQPRPGTANHYLLDSNDFDLNLRPSHLDELVQTSTKVEGWSDTNDAAFLSGSDSEEFLATKNNKVAHEDSVVIPNPIEPGYSLTDESLDGLVSLKKEQRFSKHRHAVTQLKPQTINISPTVDLKTSQCKYSSATSKPKRNAKRFFSVKKQISLSNIISLAVSESSSSIQSLRNQSKTSALAKPGYFPGFEPSNYFSPASTAPRRYAKEEFNNLEKKICHTKYKPANLAVQLTKDDLRFVEDSEKIREQYCKARIRNKYQQANKKSLDSCTYLAEKSADEVLSEKEEASNSDNKKPFFYGVYGNAQVWVEEMPIGGANKKYKIIEDKTASFANDYVTLEDDEDAAREGDEIEEYIHPQPVHTIQYKYKRRSKGKSKYFTKPTSVVPIKYLPMKTRPRPRGKVAVCMIFRLVGLTVGSFTEEDEKKIKHIIIGILDWIRFLAVVKRDGIEYRSQRKLEEGDVNIYLKQDISGKTCKNLITAESSKRVRIGVEIWVKKKDSEKAARALYRATENNLFASEIRTKCPSIIIANQKLYPVNKTLDSPRNTFLTQKSHEAETEAQIEDEHMPQENHSSSHNENVEFSEYSPTAVMSPNPGKALWDIHLRIQAGLDITVDSLSKAHEEILARSWECEQSKGQFERDTRKLQDSYRGAISKVANWKKTLYRALLESNYREENKKESSHSRPIQNFLPSPTSDPMKVKEKLSRPGYISRRGILTEF